MNVDPPSLLKTCRSELNAIGAAVRGAVDQRERQVPSDFRTLLHQLDSRRRA